MKGSKVPGIIMICSGFVLCVVDAFVPGLIFILVGIFTTITAQPSNKNTQNQAPTKKPAASKSRTSAPVKGGNDLYAFNGTAEEYFGNLLSSAFPGYSIERNVKTLAASGVPAAPVSESWKCACGAENTGRFCSECGSPKPVSNVWTCSCGAVNKGKFCSECGNPKPETSSNSPAITLAYEGDVPVNFLLLKDGQPKLAIILISKKYYSKKAVRSTMTNCDIHGIPCLRFFPEFRNEAGYVVNRVRDAMR